MRIKRYFAEEMRFAIRSVREDLGPDAVILSSRKVDGGMEVVAAIDYDESWLHETAAGPEGRRPAGEPGVPPGVSPDPSGAGDGEPAAPGSGLAAAVATGPPPPPFGPPPARAPGPSLATVGEELKSLRELLEAQLSGLAWGDFGRRHPLRAELLRRLLELGIGRQLAHQLAEEVAEPSEPRAAWRQVLASLVQRLPVTENDVIAGGGIVALLGPTGVGKTTTIAKLAARYALGHGSQEVALVTTDGYRIGAHEQLRTYAELMGMPMQICRGPEDLGKALARFEDRRLVLIDTAGMSQRDVRLSEQAALIEGGSPAVRRFLVLSATTQPLGLDESVRAYRGVPFDGCIVTKLDEATSLGGVLSVVIQHGLPVAYVGDGQRVPEDLKPARAHRLVSQAVAVAGPNRAGGDDESVALVFAGMSAHAG